MYCAKAASAFAAESQLVIDVVAGGCGDSAGLALLIEWYRLAERAKHRSSLVGHRHSWSRSQRSRHRHRFAARQP